jgi:pyruvate dehydrogenase (quinone)
VVPDDSPYTTGGIGLLGTAPSQDAMQACDTLLIAGSSFPYMEFYPKPGKAKCVQIDLDPIRIGLRHPVEVGLVGDCKSVLRAMLPLIQPKKDRSFLEKAQKSMIEWIDLLQKRASWKDKPLKPQVVAFHLNKFLADDAIVTTDCGTVTSWAARYVMMRDRMMFSSSGMLATMGNGLPYSVAAAVAYPGRQVVCLSGDGGFTMLMGELLTLVKYKLPVKVIVLKNNVLGQIKWEQMVFEGNPQFGVELQPMDFALFARACGAAGFTLDDPDKAE